MTHGAPYVVMGGEKFMADPTDNFNTKMRVTYALPDRSTETVEGYLVPAEGPFRMFFCLKVDDEHGQHLLINWDSIVKIKTTLPEVFLAPMDIVMGQREMTLLQAREEITKELNNPTGGIFG
mgnify:CR=1 FL=1|tara:strand:- start:59 stop:424 length:366 start_codon:yes stop_codon:yes gene_type:complete